MEFQELETHTGAEDVNHKLMTGADGVEGDLEADVSNMNNGPIGEAGSEFIEESLQ